MKQYLRTVLLFIVVLTVVASTDAQKKEYENMMY